MPLLCGLSILERLARIFEIRAGILAIGIEKEAVEALIQIVMYGDVASGVPPVVPLVQVAKRHPRLVQRLDPELPLELGEIAGAQFQEAVKITLGEDDASVHVKFAQAQRGIEHQLPFGRTIKKLDAKERACPVAEGLNGSVGGFDFEPTFSNQSPQINVENRVNHSESPSWLCRQALPSRAQASLS